jgi:hypothetical protein
MDKIISGLQSRVFLMSNAHEDEPVLMTTRWAMSYLRGPLTRDQIKQLMDPIKKSSPITTTAHAAAEKKPAAAESLTSQAPSLPIGISAYYAPSVRAGEVTYQPYLLGVARIVYTDSKLKVSSATDAIYLTGISDAAIPVDWQKGWTAKFLPDALEKTARPGAKFGNVPQAAGITRNYTEWAKDFSSWLLSNQTLTLYKNRATGLLSSPGESEQEFKLRLGQNGRENRDEVVEKLRAKYAPKYRVLQEKLKKAQAVKQRESSQSKEKGFQTAVKVGGALLSAFTGRKLFSQTNINKASTAIRGVGSSASAVQEYNQAVQAEKAIQQEMNDLQALFDAELAAMGGKGNPAQVELETVVIKPKKTDIDVQLVTLVWVSE